MLDPVLIAAGAGALGAVGALLAARWSYLVAAPDEWLLRLRGGRLVDAGVGISLWRRPGDVVARFTSTVQRVKFATEVLTKDHLAIKVDGFALWSISPVDDGPFRAFRKLGVANLDAAHPDLKSDKHLLTTAQYHAFQALLAAAVRGHAAEASLHAMLSDQRSFLEGLSERLDPFCQASGIELERLELLEVRPVDATVAKNLGARQEESVREEATQARVRTGERLKQDEIASQRATSLARLEAERELAERKAALERERQLAADAAALEALEARLAREERELAARLDRSRREAEARRDAILAVAAAEEKKSPAVRAHELAVLATEKVADVLSGMPLQEARWVTVGPDSPVASVAGIVAGLREMVVKPPKAVEG